MRKYNDMSNIPFDVWQDDIFTYNKVFIKDDLVENSSALGSEHGEVCKIICFKYISNMGGVYEDRVYLLENIISKKRGLASSTYINKLGTFIDTTVDLTIPQYCNPSKFTERSYE